MDVYNADMSQRHKKTLGKHQLLVKKPLYITLTSWKIPKKTRVYNADMSHQHLVKPSVYNTDMAKKCVQPYIRPLV